MEIQHQINVKIVMLIALLVMQDLNSVVYLVKIQDGKMELNVNSIVQLVNSNLLLKFYSGLLLHVNHVAVNAPLVKKMKINV